MIYKSQNMAELHSVNSGKPVDGWALLQFVDPSNCEAYTRRQVMVN